MLDKVELAIRKAMHHEGDTDPTTPRRYALAAVKAMREPDEVSIRAIDIALHEHWPNARKMATAVQQAMIDSILSEIPEMER